MPELKCPVCGQKLNTEGRSMRCAGGHVYDIARQGYVNLLMSNRSADKRHGDDRLMVQARQSFLEKGYYACLRDELCRLAVSHCGNGETDLLDAGCGECWYSAAVKSAVENAGGTCAAVGVDISRQALIAAARRASGIQLAVAGVNALPVMDGSCSLLLNVFAPGDEKEFARVLRKGGILLKAVPLERHLYALKAAVYDHPYENQVEPYRPEGFRFLGRTDLRTHIRLDRAEDIRNLFMMTPYYYKTGKSDQMKLDALEALDTEVEFGVNVLERA